MKTIKAKPFTIEYDDKNPYETDFLVKHEDSSTCKFRFTNPDESKSVDMSITIYQERNSKEYKKIIEYIISAITSNSDKVVFIRTDKLPDGELASALRNAGFADDVDGETDIANIQHVVYEVQLVSWMSIFMCMGMSVGLAIGKVYGMCIGMAMGLCIGGGLDATYKPERQKLRNKRKEILTGVAAETETADKE